MTSISPKEKKSESNTSDTNNASESKNKKAEIRGKDNETETSTDNTVLDAQVRGLQSAADQFENPIGDQSGNTEVDRGKDCSPVEEKGADGLSGDTEHLHKGNKDLMPTQQTCSSGFQQKQRDQIAKTTPISSGKQPDSKSKTLKTADEGLQSARAQFENSSGDQSGNTVVDEGNDDKPVKEKDDDTQSIDSANVDTEVDDTNNASESKNKEAEIRGKDNETETSTDNTGLDAQDKGLQSAAAQFENPIGDQSGNTVVDRGKDCSPVEEKGDYGLSGDTEHVHKEKDVEHTGKTTNVSHTGKKVNAKHDSKSDNREGIEEMTKLIPSACQTETKTGKQVNKKTHSKSGVSSSGDSRQVDDERTTPIPSQIKKQLHSVSETLKTADEGSDSEPEIKDEGSPPQPSYSGLPQQRPQQIREGTDNNLPWIGIVIVLVSVVCSYYLHVSGSTPNKLPKQLDMVEVFNQEMEKLQASFPNQRPELWKRSLIHIRRHLKTEHPTEPVSLILTSGRRAEKTLGCLAQCLAQAFSTTRNSTFLNIDGKAKTSLDSDQVKLDIDSELTKAFESEKFAAVIHRFEELPPGSTLIFYRYCDHENAAYKNVFLAFTVMLDAEAEVPSNINLGRIEEMVQDHVKQKFVSSDKSAVFNQMDVDKLSGLWSRISHLILPVAAEEGIEQHGCRGCDKPF